MAESKLECTLCKNTYFEEIAVSEYRTTRSLALGQKPPKYPGNTPLWLLKCLNCNELSLPPVMRQYRDAANKQYEELMKVLARKKADILTSII